MKNIHKEPLLHFLIIGVMIFILYSIVNKEENAQSGDKIVITVADIERLSDNWSKKWTRKPTRIELHGLVDSFIKEEVYYREAIALGLDQNDTVLRRRLRQKMEFLSNDLAELNQPNEFELNRYFLDNPDKYELPPRVSFTHIYFSTDKRGTKAFDDANKVLAALNKAMVPERGDSFALQYDFQHETPFAVERLFGKDFAEHLFKLEPRTWQGPVASSYGFHLVRIEEKIDSRMPEFDSVIEKVHTDWMFEQRQKMNKEIYERLKKRYEIVVEDMPIQFGIAKSTISGRESYETSY